MAPHARRQFTIAANLAALVIGMVLLTYASVPLYRLFCQVTGFGGTTQRESAQQAELLARATPLDRMITVRFNADTDPGLPWRFTPDQTSVRARVGESTLISYSAENLTDTVITGRAVYNVVPHKAGPYFVKVECFCFQNQKLMPHQSVHMPVSFFLDPSLKDDLEMKDVHEITLSYTFFPATSESDSK